MRTTLITVLVLLCASFASAQSTTVTWTNVHQTYDGFGGSTGYNERNQNMTAAVADCFFSNIDANCTATAHSIGLEWIRIQDNATANNTPDAATVQLAFARGAKVFLSFNGPQLYTGSYASQASYMVNKILYWKNTNGVPISTISVQNEPGTQGTTPAAIDIFIASYLGPAMSAAGLGSIPIIPGEGADWFITDYVTPCLTDSNCSKYVTTVAGHGYWQSNQSGTQAVDGFTYGAQCCVDYVANLPPAVIGNLGVWQTELHGGFSPYSSPAIPYCVNDPSIAGFDGSIANAMIWAHNFHDFFTVMNGTGWQYWNLAAQTADGPPPDCNDGLTHAYTNSPPYAPALRFYVVGNWSKYIQSGWVRIDSNPTTAQQTSGTTNPPQGVYVTAWKNGSTGTLFTIVAVNTNTVAKTLTTTLSGFPSIGGGTVTPIITSGSNNLAPQTPIAVTSNAFSYSLPANSVVTFTGAIGGSSAHTYTAASCSRADFATVFAEAVDGDTILGPSGGGSATWSSPINSTITPALVNGNGCVISATVTPPPCDSQSAQPCGNDIFQFTWNNSAIVPRVTNFTFNNAGTQAILNLNGSVPQFRVDHITHNATAAYGNPYFALLGYQYFQESTPQLYGLFDHITYNCTQDATCDAFLFYGRDWAWTQPTTMGTLQAVYIEDSTFTCSACTGQHFNTVTDAQHGARFVARYNTFGEMSISEHDVGVNSDRGTRQYEYYNNIFSCTNPAGDNTCFDASAFRGGSNMVFNNQVPIDAAGKTGWQTLGFTQIFRFTCQYCGQIPWLFTIANPNLIYAPSGGTGSGASTGGVCSDFVPHDTTSSHLVCGSSSTTCIANPTPAQASAGQCGKAFYDSTITNTLLTQVDGGGSGGYPARDQTGTSADSGVNHTQVGGGDPSYIFNNTNPNAGGAKIYSAVTNNDSPLLADNRDYYDEQSASGNGSTVGVGVGVLASRSATCTTGVGYWATDQSVLYTCGPTNTWNVHYTPLVHPHPLQGGGAPIPTWTPSIYAFGGVLTTNTATKSINLQNTGSIPLNISITMSGSSTFTQTNTCGPTLAIGASCTVVVQFAPTSVTSFTGTLTETDSVNSVSSSVALSGSGVSAIPAVSWTPSTYNFGNVTTGSTPSSTFTLQNTGVGLLNVSLSVTGSATFTNPSTTCGATLTAGATCTATVQFAPVAAGTVTGSLVETDTPNGVTGSAALTGTGASAGTAQIQITPATTLFNPNKTQTVTVTNIGGATETLATPFYVFSGANAADFSVTGGTCSNGGTITASSTCTVVVQWSPTTGLDEVGVLAVNGTASTTGNLKGIPVAYPGTFILF